MKTNKIVLVIGILVLLIAIIPVVSVSAAPGKVNVCHRTGNGSYNLINISTKALSAHLAHGDGMPGDPVPNMADKVFDVDCAVVDAPPVPIYDSIPAVYPGSFPSLGYEATSTDEFGDHIFFAGTARSLQTVEVSLTDWACENDATRGPADPCVTTPGSFFAHPITLNLYAVDYSSGDPAPGALLGTVTTSFNIPYRPSWDSVNCTAAGQTPATDVPFGGRWYDPVLGACVHGYAFNITFDFASLDLTLPNEVIYGIAYNTADYGVTPIGVPGPYNSLNVSLTEVSPTIGIDFEPDTTFWDTSYGPFYCDGGIGGSDTFRRDAGCWAPYSPVVRFNAGN